MSEAHTPQGPTQEHLDELAKRTGDDAAKYWLDHIYQGDNARQLTVRAVVTGMLIGGVMSISNLYVGLKTGWGLGVTITACIIAYAVFNVLQEIIPAYRTRHFSILENYTMSSAASAAGYMSSAGLVSSLPALYMATGRSLLWWELMIWLGAVSFLGVFMAIPLKRQLINIDQLPFPSGIATAETLRSMHSSGAEAMRKAASLAIGAAIGAIVGFAKNFYMLAMFASQYLNPFHMFFKEDRLKIIRDDYPFWPSERAHYWSEKLTFGIEGSLIMVAAGAIMGIRVGVTLLIGAIIYFGIIGSFLVEHGITAPGYGGKGINSWTLWPSTALMVTAGLTSFALKWRTIVRAFSGLRNLMRRSDPINDPLSRVEVPTSWFIFGTLASGAVCVVFGAWRFEVQWWMGIVAVLVTFLLSIVAARATGETDITPIGAMGKITQLMYGVIAPQNMTTNLMTASITAGAASHSADLLTDLKSGYLLGGNPRKQAISQLFGVVAGTLFCVPVYLVVARPEKLGTAELPATAAQVWAGVARVLAQGAGSLPTGALEAMIVAGLIGIQLALAEEFVPADKRKWIPSATALGIAGVIPAANSVSMFVGAFIAWLVYKIRPVLGERYVVSTSSGVIAGETLMSVGIILLTQGPGMIQELIRQSATTSPPP